MLALVSVFIREPALGSATLPLWSNARPFDQSYQGVEFQAQTPVWTSEIL